MIKPLHGTSGEGRPHTVSVGTTTTSHLFGSDGSLCFAGKSAKARLGRRIEVMGDPRLGWRLVRLLKRLDQRISRCIDPVPNPLITVKGLGPASPLVSWPRLSIYRCRTTCTRR